MIVQPLGRQQAPMQGLGEQVVPVTVVPVAHPASPVEGVQRPIALVQHAIGQMFGEHEPPDAHVPLVQAACDVTVQVPVDEQHEPWPAAKRGIPKATIASVQMTNACLAAFAHVPLRVMSSESSAL
jgi:hypothetical protein